MLCLDVLQNMGDSSNIHNIYSFKFLLSYDNTCLDMPGPANYSLSTEVLYFNEDCFVLNSRLHYP
jgi:hypothetical protein